MTDTQEHLVKKIDLTMDFADPLSFGELIISAFSLALGQAISRNELTQTQAEAIYDQTQNIVLGLVDGKVFATEDGQFRDPEPTPTVEIAQ